ncbi:transposase [Bifidobacterium gallicum]|nr:transposase [Bifidobacterium gallicum]
MGRLQASSQAGENEGTVACHLVKDASRESRSLQRHHILGRGGTLACGHPRGGTRQADTQDRHTNRRRHGSGFLAALSDGEKIPNPRFRKRNAKRLGKAQRNLARKQKGSRNYEKARLKVARIQAQGADRRKDFLHKLSTRIIRENQTVVLEDLAVRNMCRKAAPKEDRAHPGRYLPNGRAAKRGLNRSITDAGWRMFRTMLEYKAAWYGRQLIVIDRWYPSSQICSHCGKNNGKKPLNVRAWTCPYCHTTHDRDVNAAKNILAAGLAVNVCGDGRKHHNN